MCFPESFCLPTIRKSSSVPVHRNDRRPSIMFPLKAWPYWASAHFVHSLSRGLLGSSRICNRALSSANVSFMSYITWSARSNLGDVLQGSHLWNIKVVFHQELFAPRSATCRVVGHRGPSLLLLPLHWTKSSGSVNKGQQASSIHFFSEWTYFSVST